MGGLPDTAIGWFCQAFDLSDRDPPVSTRQTSTNTATTVTYSAACIAHSGAPVVNSPRVMPVSTAVTSALQISLVALLDRRMRCLGLIP